MTDQSGSPDSIDDGSAAAPGDAGAMARRLVSLGMPVSALADAMRAARSHVYACLDGDSDALPDRARLATLHGLLSGERPRSLRWFNLRAERSLSGGGTLRGMLGAWELDPVAVRAGLDEMRPGVERAMERDAARAGRSFEDGPPGLANLWLEAAMSR